jgi:hypothetical protein
LLTGQEHGRTIPLADFRAADLIWFRVERGNHAVWLWHVSDIRMSAIALP